MFDGFNTQQQQRRQYPFPADQVYAAVRTVVSRDYDLRDDDDLTRTITFSSHASMLTWGENVTVTVMDAERGCDVEISGVGKVGGQVQQATTLVATFATFYAALSAELRVQRDA